MSNKINIHSSKDNFEILIPISKYYQYIFIFGTATVIFLYFVLWTISQSIIFQKINIKIIMFIISFLLMFFLFLTLSLWFLNGKEVLKITHYKIIFIETNGILKFKKEYNISDLNEIKVKELDYNTNSIVERGINRIREKRRALFFWSDMGKIIFDFNNKSFSYFNGISDDETIEIMELIKTKVHEIINEHTTKNWQ